ncbi:MAG: transposase [Thermomicrobiales bacterium]
MRSARISVFLQLVWSTWDRLPLLEEQWARDVYRVIGAQFSTLRAAPIAIGGIEDHVHLLVALPATLCIADLAGQVKGASAHFMTHQLAPGSFFRWQGAYAAFSLAAADVPRVSAYIARQREHHAAGTVMAQWEMEGE